MTSFETVGVPPDVTSYVGVVVLGGFVVMSSIAGALEGAVTDMDIGCLVSIIMPRLGNGEVGLKESLSLLGNLGRVV